MNAKTIENIDVGRVCDLMRQVVRESGLSQAEVSRRLGLSRYGVANTMRKGRNPNVRTVIRVLDVCGYDLVVEAVRREPRSRRARLIAEAKGEKA